MIEPGQKLRLLAGTLILYFITVALLFSSLNKFIQSPYHIGTSESSNYQIGIDPTPAPPIPPPNSLKN